MSKKPTSNEELAEEAQRWDSRELTPAGWEDAPDAVPNAKASESISLRLPKAMLEILKKFAKREGIGYQVLMKRWLDDRIRKERERLRKPELVECPRGEVEVAFLRIVAPLMISQAASFDARSVPRLPAEAGTDPFGQLAELTTRR
jgi:predicted DNA binding CopG/RHH family protein